jgi:hypothetical protein
MGVVVRRADKFPARSVAKPWNSERYRIEPANCEATL